jgi:hypothetical protein
MVDAQLSRNAGPIALVAGGMFAAVDVALFALMDTDHRIEMLTDPTFRIFNAAYFFAFVGLAIGLVALYARHAGRSGWLGTFGFLAALVGTMVQGGNMWFDGFAAPWLAEVVPQAFTAEKTTILLTGALLSYATFALGWVLFAFTSWREQTMPVGLAIAVAVGGVLGFQSGWPPYGVPIGLAVAAVGVWLIRADRAARVPAGTTAD